MSTVGGLDLGLSNSNDFFKKCQIEFKYYLLGSEEIKKTQFIVSVVTAIEEQK